MPLSEFFKASGIRIPKKRGVAYSNVGKLYVGRSTGVGVDSHLWAVLKIVADELGVVLYISSLDTGKHAVNSRHYTGRAADISRVARVGKVLRPFTPANPLARGVVTYLLNEGFKPGEGKPQPALLFGAPETELNPSGVDHRDHVHVSLPRA